MRVREAVLYCDGDDGDCGAWDLDYYAQTCSTVNGVRITLQERAPGWTSKGDSDYCPKHRNDAWPDGTEIPFKSDGRFLPTEGVLVVKHMPEDSEQS